MTRKHERSVRSLGGNRPDWQDWFLEFVGRRDERSRFMRRRLNSLYAEMDGESDPVEREAKLVRFLMAVAWTRRQDDSLAG